MCGEQVRVRVEGEVDESSVIASWRCRDGRMIFTFTAELSNGMSAAFSKA